MLRHLENSNTPVTFITQQNTHTHTHRLDWLVRQRKCLTRTINHTFSSRFASSAKIYHHRMMDIYGLNFCLSFDFSLGDWVCVCVCIPPLIVLATLRYPFFSGCSGTAATHPAYLQNVYTRICVICAFFPCVVSAAVWEGFLPRREGGGE